MDDGTNPDYPNRPDYVPNGFSACNYSPTVEVENNTCTYPLGT
jgi:hypothetical protein